MAIAWAIGAGIGLSTLAGFRAFVPVSAFILMARLDWVWGFAVKDTPFDFFQSNVAIALLLALAALEIVLTRVDGLRGIEHALRVPLALAAGALLFTAALAGEFSDWQYLLGIPAGAAISVLGYYVYRGLTLMGEGRDPGPALDILVLFLSALMMLLPPAGYAFGLVMIWLAYRVRRLRRTKYKGLRVLA